MLMEFPKGLLDSKSGWPPVPTLRLPAALGLVHLLASEDGESCPLGLLSVLCGGPGLW